MEHVKNKDRLGVGKERESGGAQSPKKKSVEPVHFRTPKWKSVSIFAPIDGACGFLRDSSAVGKEWNKSRKVSWSFLVNHTVPLWRTENGRIIGGGSKKRPPLDNKSVHYEMEISRTDMHERHVLPANPIPSDANRRERALFEKRRNFPGQKWTKDERWNHVPAVWCDFLPARSSTNNR